VRTVLKQYIDGVCVMKVSIEFADKGMLQFRMYFYLSLKLLVEGGGIDVLLGDDFDGHLLLTVPFNGAVDYAESARADLLLYDEAVYCEGGTYP
jgi:hypothetical protein